MKNLTTILISLALHSAAQAALPEEILCKAKVITSICGNGEVNIRLKTDATFELFNGDVPCWFGPAHYRGTYVQTETNEIALGTRTFALNYESFGAPKLGSLIYMPRRQLATLEITSHRAEDGQFGGRYNLTCETLP
jgi:hypothetical protein